MHAQYYITHLSRNLCSCGWEVILLCLCTCAVHGPHFYVGADKKMLHWTSSPTVLLWRQFHPTAAEWHSHERCHCTVHVWISPPLFSVPQGNHGICTATGSRWINNEFLTSCYELSEVETFCLCVLRSSLFAAYCNIHLSLCGSLPCHNHMRVDYHLYHARPLPLAIYKIPVQLASYSRVTSLSGSLSGATWQLDVPFPPLPSAPQELAMSTDTHPQEQPAERDETNTPPVEYVIPPTKPAENMIPPTKPTNSVSKVSTLEI